MSVVFGRVRLYVGAVVFIGLEWGVVTLHGSLSYFTCIAKFFSG